MAPKILLCDPLIVFMTCVTSADGSQSYSGNLMHFACPLNHCSYKAMLINVLSPKQAIVVFLAFIRIQVQFPTSIIPKIIIRQMCVFSYLVILVPKML